MISPINLGELGGGRMMSFKGVHFEKGILLTCVRWYAAYPLTYRQLEG
jgi:transposase-like protein